MNKHIATFHLNDGIQPQIPVLMKIRDASRIELRRPRRSASIPQMSDPTVVPMRAISGSIRLSLTLT